MHYDVTTILTLEYSSRKTFFRQKYPHRNYLLPVNFFEIYCCICYDSWQTTWQIRFSSHQPEFHLKSELAWKHSYALYSVDEFQCSIFTLEFWIFSRPPGSDFWGVRLESQIKIWSFLSLLWPKTLLNSCLIWIRDLTSNHQMMFSFFNVA